MGQIKRRAFLTSGVAGLAGAAVTAAPAPGKQAAPAAGTPPPFRLGLVTYEFAKNWDIPTIIANCITTGFEAVECRTTHRHGVEISLNKEQRREVRKQFDDSPVRLLSLGTMCEYHSADRAVVDRNIEETKRWCELARDVGCLGVKVRPNGFVKEVPEEKTLEQIGNALERCGDAARDQGVELWVEVHGQGTQEPPNMLRLMELANHPAVGICWNSSDTDVQDGSVAEAFAMLQPWLRNCHINELWRTPSPWGTRAGQPMQEVPRGFPSYARQYPFREFFRLLRESKYNRYTLMEVPESSEPIRTMRYYRSLWEQLTT
jgi:sugar phosphate isomerase/epimerase